MVYQIGALHAFVQIQGGRLHHVKSHGALYNMAAKDAELADAVAKAVKDIDPELILYGLFGSELVQSACKIGLKTANEAFCDRGYQADGSLVPRSHPGAMIKDAEFAAERLIQMIQTGKVRSVDGRKIDITADTVCFHGDSPAAIHFAKALHEKLLKAGVELKAI
ncbi:MAG: LamB/YcsF family protein [Tuberibacillus sp.]